MRFITGFTALLLFAVSCGKVEKGRYIADNDTSFSADIRSISARINQDPGNAELYYRRANTFFFEKRFPDARIDIDHALILDSLNPVYHFRKAEILMATDTADSRKAMFHYAAAVRLKPGYEEALTALGKMQVARQEYTQAETTLNKILELNPGNTNAMLLLGIAYKEMKDTGRAMARFEEALRLQPNEFNAIMQIANIYAARRDPVALQYYDRALTVDEFSDEAMYAKGFLLQQLGRYKDALSLYLRTKTTNPGHRFAYYNSAVIYGIFEDWKEAYRWADDLIAIDDQFAKAFHYRGFVAEKLGRTTDAIGDYRRVLELDPANELAKEDLARLGN